MFRVLPVLIAVVLAPAAAGNAAARTGAPASAAMSAIRTSALAPAARTRLLAGSYWGGPTVAADGETVTVFMSNTYPMDPAIPAKWANFVTSLAHGTEISLLRAYVLPLTEVQSVCGESALACYSDQSSTLVTPGDAPTPSISAESVIAHEYGHHLAAHRSNPPWKAVDYGTKRWASYENVCAGTAKGALHPGDEGNDYQTNPGEGFAETYRVLNERRLGLPETPWNIVTNALYPDQAALNAVLLDVTQPWTGDKTTAYRGTSGRRYTIATPLDGPLAIRIAAAARTKVQLQVGTSTLKTTLGGSRTLTSTVCGSRTLALRVTRTAGKGGYTLSVTKP